MAPKPTTPFDGCAWVTGASSGIGRATALALAKKGWRVAVTARNEEKLQALVSEAADGYGKIIPMPGDVTDATRMAAIIDELEKNYSGIGLAVLNAGLFRPVTGDQLTTEVFETTFSTNLSGTTNCLVPLSHAMKKRRRGQIAIVSSTAGYGGIPTSAAYGATKAGLINMAESLKFDFDKMGILIQVINPGFVDTPATRANDFAMPHLMKVDEAAEELLAGLDSGKFEITFPKKFTRMMKFVNSLPYWAYFPMVKRSTKWDERPLDGKIETDGTPLKHW